MVNQNLDYEFVFINDGSDDNSLNELIILHQRDSKVKIISFSRNFGQVSAVIAGLKEITGDVTINISADLQEPIELISEMISKWQSGNEIVICHRTNREDGFIANKASNFFYKLMKYVNPKMPKGGFDFVLIDKKAVAVLNQIDERNRFFQGDILWLGFNVAFIPYSRLKRTIGKSQWTLSKKLKYFIDGLLNTSYIPIRLMSFIGMIISFLGFIYATVIAYSRLINNTPFNGWAPIMILILIIGGLIMLMLGIIGEYVWRTYDEARKRPLYIIKEKFQKDETAS
jgi:dolichol-phosphate mannosyltransferase